MTKRALPPEEVRKRLIRLRNLEYLHEQQRFKIWHLRDENRELKKEVKELKSIVAEQSRTIEDLKLQIEELRMMIFRKRRKRGENDADDDLLPPSRGTLRTLRIKDSYRRPVPTPEEVTEVREHPVDRCTRCSGEFSERDHTVFYEEDIPLPTRKTVVRHTIEKGYCTACGAWSTGRTLPSSVVILGNYVCRYVVYLSVVCRQSYAQIQEVLRSTYDFHISSGEIGKIMEREGRALRPEYEAMKERIRGEPSVHLDETGWNLLVGDGIARYAWTMVGGESSDAIYLLGKTRGKGNAEDLLGQTHAVVVSDDYAAYRNLDQPHQLCLAHILRKLRDVAQSHELDEETHDHCKAAYETFAAIYNDIETARASPTPSLSYDTFLDRLRVFAADDSRDPAKLVRIKAQVRERSERYLTCLTHPSVSADNNAAERALRHLVLKRKISFGSFSERTAEMLAILASVLLSFRRRGMLRGYLMGV